LMKQEVIVGSRRSAVGRPKTKYIRFAACCVLLSAYCLLTVPGCSSQPAARTLTLATTTSARDTGLLDVLTPRFKEQSGIEVKVVAVGTGQALELARRGDADVLLVHDPESEEKFMAEGFGATRRPLMYNDFVLVGPPDDPAGVKGEKSIVKAFAQLAAKEAPFYSRGDESGTHLKEKKIWSEDGIEPKGDWYRSAGAGMAAVLRIANEKNGYTLTDRGTYLSQRKNLNLVILSEGDPLLLNRYSVIVVNPAKHPHVHHPEAVQFLEFMTSSETRKTIAAFGVDLFGEPLFHVEGAGKETGR
jgi:tungstate transport system substrate-binding protein